MERLHDKIHSLADRLFGNMEWYKKFFITRQLMHDKISAVLCFGRQKARIKKNLNLLADKKSRRVYLGMIKFRITRKESDFPGYEGNQYFPQDIINMNCLRGGVFVDCGGYDGDTSLEFITKTEGDYKRIVVFEPDEGLQNKIKARLTEEKNITMIKQGVWNKDTNVHFNICSNGMSKIVPVSRNMDKRDIIEVTAIDNCDVCREAAFIKMDIEGAEWKALHGAERLIIRNHPVLAICIYHSHADMIRIIPYIHRLCPEYKLYVRQHSYSTSETVLYAVV